MSIAEELIQKGRQEGRQEGWQKGLERGTLIGRIQICQELMSSPVTNADELEQHGTERLQELLHGLERQLRSRLG